MRRQVNENYGFEKLYSQGLSIRTPLNINYQIQAIKSLRKGIEEYDRRRGWRGPITNVKKDKNWKKKIDNLRLDPTWNWKIGKRICCIETISKTISSLRIFLMLKMSENEKMSLRISKCRLSQEISRIGSESDRLD